MKKSITEMDDFNQIEKQLIIQEIISNIKSKPANLVLDNLIVLSAVMSTINGLVFPSVILTITSLYRSIYNLQLDYSNKKNIKREIEAAVRNTDTYKICLEEYKSYLEKLSSFMKNNLGITDVCLVANIFFNMLENGLLSYNKSHCYSNYPLYETYYDLPELYGCRIATGNSVCRHRASFIVDLEQSLNNNAYYATNFPVNKKSIYLNTPDLSDYFLCHAISILKDKKDSLYIFDPTMNFWSTNLSSMRDIEGKEYITYEISDYIFFIPNNCIFNSYTESENPVFIDITKKNNNLNENTQLAYSDCVYDQLTKEECEQFYIDTKEQLFKIKSSYEEIVPLTKNKVKKHIIR